MEKLRWAPKLRRERLIALYRAEARRLPDPVLLEDVGDVLYQRCRSVIMVSDTNGAVCPRCGTDLAPGGIRWAGHDAPRCSCGWRCSFDDWRQSWRHRELNGANAIDAFRGFVQAWPRANSIKVRMVLIDQVIHAFHYGLRETEGRPAANNLIEGSVAQVVKLLDEIGDATFGVHELAAQHDAWRSTSSEMVRRRRRTRSPASD